MPLIKWGISIMKKAFKIIRLKELGLQKTKTITKNRIFSMITIFKLSSMTSNLQFEVINFFTLQCQFEIVASCCTLNQAFVVHSKLFISYISHNQMKFRLNRDWCIWNEFQLDFGNFLRLPPRNYTMSVKSTRKTVFVTSHNPLI